MTGNEAQRRVPGPWGGQKKGGCGLLGTGCLAGMLKRLQMDCADGYTT